MTYEILMMYEIFIMHLLHSAVQSMTLAASLNFQLRKPDTHINGTTLYSCYYRDKYSYSHTYKRVVVATSAV